ncbi:MAG: glucose-6-phosphate dehydrogenase [Candidatus Saccharimonadales bacterium]
MSSYVSETSAIILIFGITGDLAQRKLLPTLYNLEQTGELPENTRIIGISRHEVSVEDVYAKLKDKIGDSYSPAIARLLHSRTEMRQMDLLDPREYQDLLKYLDELDSANDPALRLYYLSIPPSASTPIIRLLGQTGHNISKRCGRQGVRLMAEKPFGYDLQSAKELIEVLEEHFEESQMYRIDHYVAKETVQNILTFRFKNPLFDSVWNNKHIDHITVLAYEKIGVEGRANFYEQTGALRDLIQSHLLQLLTFTTMEEPNKMECQNIHDTKLALLRDIRPIAADQVANSAVRGQYDGYREEVDRPSSNIETYAQVKLEIDNDTWRGVPIVLETGKALSEKTTEITVCFKQPHGEGHPHNRLVFRIQPDEGITLLLQVKRPGIDDTSEQVKMKFDYDTTFSKLRSPTGYERVMVEALRGDQTLFSSADEVLASWAVIQHVIEEWSKGNSGLLIYKKGSTGPEVSLNPHNHRGTKT